MDENNNIDQKEEATPNAMPGSIMPNQPVMENQILTIPVDIKSFTGWATFRAVMDIITGAIACSTIIGAAFGVPLILAAMKLLNYIDDIKKALIMNDKQKFANSVEFLQKYFKLSGISTIVRISMMIVLAIIYIAFFVFLFIQIANGDISFDSSSFGMFNT